jgi:hexosaminidase
MEWEVTSLLKEAGTYSVIFQYTDGAHRLGIQSAGLLIDDKVIAKDEHLGITGGMTKDNIYTLNVRQYDKSACYILRAVLRGDGGTDSNGNVYFNKQ